MANFAFTSTQKWVHMRSLTGQEYNVLQPELKVSIVPMDSSSSRCIGRGVPEFDARVETAGWGLKQRPRKNFWHIKVESMDGSQYRQLFTMFGTPQGLNMSLTNVCS